MYSIKPARHLHTGDIAPHPSGKFWGTITELHRDAAHLPYPRVYGWMDNPAYFGYVTGFSYPLGEMVPYLNR